MELKTERIYTKPADLDGYRVLVDRLWPRGISKVDAHLKMTGVNITNGPGKLIQALGIHSRSLDGQPMETSPLRVDLDRYKIPREIMTTQRIGVNMQGKDGANPQRFIVAGNPYVSGMRKRMMDLEKHGWKD